LNLKRLRAALKARFLSPKDLLVHAGVILVAYAVAHLLGLREYTTILSGTLPAAGLGHTLGAGLGVLYIVLYVGVVVIVPVLILASGMLVAAGLLRASRWGADRSSSAS